MPGTRSIVQRRRKAASIVGARPLRPPAALLHKAPFCEASASRYAKATLCAGRRCAPYGFTKKALCKVAYAGSGRVNRRRLPVASAPYAPPPGHPFRWRGPLASVSALRAVFQSVACGQSPRISPARPKRLRRLPRPPPWGSHIRKQCPALSRLTASPTSAAVPLAVSLAYCRRAVARSRRHALVAANCSAVATWK